MNKPKYHHYVPQCYLKKFSLDRTNIHYYDKQQGKCDQKGIRYICQEEDFYTLSQTDDIYYIETTFFANDNEEILGKALNYFEKLDSCCSEVPYDRIQRDNLSKQIILQYMRTPSYRNIKRDNELNAYYLPIMCLCRQIGFEIEGIEYLPNNNAEFHKNLLLEEGRIKEIMTEISEAEWELLRATSGEFYTSDNPVTIRARHDMPVTYCDAIMYFDEIFYPLNSNLLLHIIAKPAASIKKLNIRTVSNNELCNINDFIKSKAKRYILYKNKFE